MYWILLSRLLLGCLTRYGGYILRYCWPTTKHGDRIMRVVYILHFHRPYCHCLHYVGSTINIKRRTAEHRRGVTTGLMKAVYNRGISFTLAKVMYRKKVRGKYISGYDLEYYLKYQYKKIKSLCPICTKYRYT